MAGQRDADDMATSNRERVGKGFELFAEGMNDFIDRHMAAATPANVDWLDLLAAKDEQRSGAARSLSKTDPAVQLRVLTENRQAFASALSREHTQIAGLLRSERNRWAHDEAFTPRQALNALDHMSHLLVAAAAKPQAEAVEKLWHDTNAAMVETGVRKATRDADAPGASGEGLKPWREVVQPHLDITSGNFNAAEYAANLGRVADETAEDEYRDPVEFFRRTYLTEGLRRLLPVAARRLAGDLNAAPVYNLQTNFGGGKTHSMLALHHLASGTPRTAYPDDLQALLDGIALPEKINRAAFVGNDVAPGMVHAKPDGTEVRTMWGELAWQLGGAAGYALVADADRTASNPGDAFRRVLQQASPCLILVDEWVAYGRQFLERDEQLVAGTFETQFTFAQLLTEAVTAVPGAFLAVSLPQSQRDNNKKDGGLETGGELGRQVLERLMNVIGRAADQWHPATQDEAFEIVRRRLFRERDADAHAQIAVTAKKFLEMYGREDGFPTDARQPGYRRRIESCYPIHPELFDRMYQTWSTLERFQRTRGVLRLMSTVIKALWDSNDNTPLIMPGTVPLAAQPVIDELAGYLEDQWRAIVDTDVAGQNSTPKKIDEMPVYGARHMTQRLARTLFFGSAPTLGTPNQGIDRQHLLLGTAVPGDTVNNYVTSLQRLSDAATYLYSEHGRWWYNTQPSMTRTAKEYADNLRERVDDVYAEIVSRLRAKEGRLRGDFAAVYVSPTDPGAVPDREQVCLVICHPRYEHRRKAVDSTALEFVMDVLEPQRKNPHPPRTPLENRNMLALLAADGQQLEMLLDTVRSYMAWSHISKEQRDYLTGGQVKQAETRAGDLDRTVDAQIAETYTWVIAPEQPDPHGPVLWEPIKADTMESTLAVRAAKKLKNKGDLYIQSSPEILHQYLTTALAERWQKGHISVGELWLYLRKYYYLPRLAKRDVLDSAVESVLTNLAWQHQGFALATGYDEKTGKYEGLAFLGYGSFGSVTDSTLLVRPNIALQQQEVQSIDSGSSEPSDGSTSTTGAGTDEPTPQRDAPEDAPKNHYFAGVLQIDSDQFSKPLATLQDEVLPHLIGEGSSLRLTIKIEATNADGFDPQKEMIVNENARQMRFHRAQFNQTELEFGSGD